MTEQIKEAAKEDDQPVAATPPMPLAPKAIDTGSPLFAPDKAAGSKCRPAYGFDPVSLKPILPLEAITPEWAWGGSTGKGVKVAVIDSGIDASHPAVRGSIIEYVAISEGPAGFIYDTQPHADSCGHGTACAGIIRAVAPQCHLYSVKVLGTGLFGRAVNFVAGLRWAIENRIHVCNLSLGTTKKDFFGILHELSDLAYCRNVMLVTSPNNVPAPSFPSVYASVISVASHDREDPYLFYYNPEPPVEFCAHGINVRVAWLNGGWLTATGNSFAAPHIAGLIAKILGRHPDLTPFHMKVVLRALSANVAEHTARLPV
jgi:subtilisin